MNINSLSEKLLLAVKKQQSTSEIENELSQLELNLLKSTLNTDDKKKAFWVNTYNAFYQILRKRDGFDVSTIYTSKAIEIAKTKFSLDEIEHGILRRYRVKAALGYLPNIFAPILIKELAVDTIDYRIHFALNCGAKSCPPIAFYHPEKIEQQLETATISFLDSETSQNLKSMEIKTSSLLSWYRGDFGGTKGIKKVLKEKLKIPTEGFKLIFSPYSWEDDLANFE
jgi:hypothetical protein